MSPRRQGVNMLEAVSERGGGGGGSLVLWPPLMRPGSPKTTASESGINCVCLQLLKSEALMTPGAFNHRQEEEGVGAPTLLRG